MPLPGRKTFCFDVYLVGPGLLPEDPEKGATPDMCIPIFPAVHHPTGRPPFRPQPDFPFSNCYHWSGPEMNLDLHIKNGEFPREKGEYTWLPDRDAVILQDLCGDDTCEMYTNIACREHKLAGGGAPSVHSEAPFDSGNVFDTDAQLVLEVSQAPPFDNSSSFSSGRSRSMDRSYWSDDEEVEIDPFALDKRACAPVVQIWLDLAAQLQEDEIPNPMDFLRHHQALAAYVCHSPYHVRWRVAHTMNDSLLRKNREAEKAKWRAAREQERQPTLDQTPSRGSAISPRWTKLKCKCYTHTPRTSHV